MRNPIPVLLAGSLVLLSASSSAADGVVLIDQATVMTSGGFPYKITEPGSYRLSGNLEVKAADTTAINIDASNVTIDLNGFSITGPGSSVGLYGIADLGADTAVAVRNGTIAGFSYGLQLAGAGGLKDAVTGAIIENITVYNNGVGISSGHSSLLRDNVATGNTSDGIRTRSYSTIAGNTVTNNGDVGIATNCPSNLVGNIAVGNKANFSAPLTVITVPPCTFFNNSLP
jgi:parallel beta-helix repeat protein